MRQVRGACGLWFPFSTALNKADKGTAAKVLQSALTSAGGITADKVLSKTSSSNVCAPCLMLWEMQVLTDYAVQEERADSKWAATCQVRACGGNKAQVKVTNTTNSPWRLVDFDNKKCSCLRWQQMLRPCEHALAAYKQKVSPRSMRL